MHRKSLRCGRTTIAILISALGGLTTRRSSRPASTSAPMLLKETGTTVRLKEGKRRVQDGPYAETKEQLAGFIILELPSLDAALEWAARCPGASIGAVEVRPLAPEAMRRGFTG